MGAWRSDNGDGMVVAQVLPMPSHAALLPTGTRDQFLADHRRLDVVLEQLLASFEANDRDGVARLWTEFESGLLAHLDAEEAHLVPALLRASERDARVILGEHKHIRLRLAELGVGIDLHTVRLESARHFIDELRAHAYNEDRLLYRFADQQGGDHERRSPDEASPDVSAALAAVPPGPSTAPQR